MFTDSPELVTGLEKVKAEMMRSSQSAGSAGQWDSAQTRLQWARQLDEMLLGIRQIVNAPIRPANFFQAPKQRPAKLPYYSVEGDKLVKIGPSRDGTTYEHRVLREHFQLVVDQLSKMASESKTFETTDLVGRCDIPKHEPLIVLAVLEEQKLLLSVRRGRWVFIKSETFRSEVQGVWNLLPKY